MRARRRSQRGFTLVELMVSLVLFSLVIAGMLSIAVTMARSFREQQLTVSAEDASRQAMEFITDAIRASSPGVPDGRIEHVNTCARGAYAIGNRRTTPAVAVDTDALTIVYSPGVVTTATIPYSGGTGLSVVDGSQLRAGDSVLVTDFTTGHIAEVTNVTGNNLTLAGATCGVTLPINYAAGSMVIRVYRAQFFIADVDGIPTLMMDPDEAGPAAAEPLAEGIEDLQVMVGVDLTGDGLLENGSTTDEWHYNNVGDTQHPQPPAPGTGLPALGANTGLPVGGTVRARRVTLIARAIQPATAPIYTRPAVGDRAIAGAPDGFRRRVLNAIVEVRNLQSSP
jgi:prepilin-type N-terminal cleavage/methylation domain-containing protein